MTVKSQLSICFVGVLVIAGLVVVEARREDRRAAQQVTTAAHAADQVVATKDTAITARDAEAASFRRADEREAAAVTTPQAAAKVIVRFLPSGSVEPVQTFTRAELAQLPADLSAKLPDAPSYVVLTDTQAKDVARNELSCEADRHELTTCHADVADLRTEVAARTTEAHTAETALRGGSKWRRVGQVLKVTGCSAAAAAVGEVATHTAQGAAIGAAAGAVGCSLF